MDKLKLLAMRLRELRETLELSQSDFSESIELKQQTYAAYEKGVNKPPIDVLIKIAEKYNVSLDWLCGFSNLCAKKIRLDTYADVLHLIFELGFLDGAELDSNFYKDKNEDERYFSPDPQYSEFMMLYFNDTKINDALKKWKRMFDLLKNGTIDEEIYRLWIEKTLPDYNSLYSADRNVYNPSSNSTIPDNAEFPFT